MSTHYAHRATFLSALLLTSLNLYADPLKVSIERNEPCNLFSPDEEVQFQVKTAGELPDQAKAVVLLKDENGNEITKKTVTQLGKEFTVDLGKPGRGYYDLIVTVSSPGDEKGTSGAASLGVIEFVNRSAEEVRNGNYVFGLKWWSGIKRQPQVLDAMCKLGLQWTRIIQNEGHPNESRNSGKEPAKATGKAAGLKVENFFNDYPMNAAVKVERFPVEAYDAKRYGPLEEYEAKWGRGHWVVKTVPQASVYKPWLQEQLKRIPDSQKVFEIWNEPWDKMSPEELAEICQMVADAILEVRPDAIIGPNLTGKKGKYEYDNQMIEAGGLKRLKMVALHPYANPMDRELFREYKKWLEEKVGHEMQIYITEYGSHNTPEGPQQQSDLRQAKNVARRSIALYSNGVQALVPHIAVSAEKDRTYWDDWLGLFRNNEQPKPALLAHANAARMIDGSTYLGDLWFGPQIEAMVFDRKDGKKILATWTEDRTRPGAEAPPKEIELAATGDVTVTDLVGRQSVLKPQNGKVKITLDDSPIYVAGFDPQLLAQASKELRPDRWPKPEKPPKNRRLAGSLPKVPSWDGSFPEWKNAKEFAFVNEAVNAKDASGVGYIGWDDNFLYIGADAKDNEMMNKEVLGKLYRGDSIELFVSTEPREDGAGFGPNDYQFFLTPTSQQGRPVIGHMVERESGEIIELKTAKYFAGATKDGWAIELGIPWSYFKGFKPEKGARLMMEMRLNDADTSHKRWMLDPGDISTVSVNDPTKWSLVELAE